MSTVILNKWGNSMGIRIPATIIKEAHLAPGEELTITVNKKGSVVLMPVKNPQAGWTEKFNAIADTDQSDALIDLPNAFDEDEWTW
jgi:antitoxin component of MazEF toxin-antitoxin module